MTSRAILACVLFAATVTANDALLNRSQKRWYDAIKPRADELKWKQIPWLTDLGEAIQLAEKEKRPLVVWSAGDEPLDRC